MNSTPDQLRQQARKRLDDQRGFIPHLIAYITVNVAIVVIWATVSHGGFFYPGFVMGFWGIGLLTHAWNAFFSRPITESEIDREVNRMQGHSA